MKISNETKIGILATISITLLILGFNFLKGNKIFQRSRNIYAIFRNVDGLEASDAVVIKGLVIGNVSAITEEDKDVQGIRVTINLRKDIHIPRNSVASISTGLITSATIVIARGDGTDYLGDGDTLNTVEKPGLMSQVESNINPVLARLVGTLQSLDSLVEVVGSLFDPRTKNNFTSILDHLAVASASIQGMLNLQSGALAKSLNNVDSFTGNLARNNEHITRTLDNLEKTSANLSGSKISETISSLNASLADLRSVIGKMNGTTGSLGLLINDKKLYQNLENSTRSLNILLDDVRVHPKRYVNISVFGRKDKSGPLSAPANDSSSKTGN